MNFLSTEIFQTRECIYFKLCLINLIKNILPCPNLKIGIEKLTIKHQSLMIQTYQQPDWPSSLLTDSHRCSPIIIVVDQPALLLMDHHGCWPTVIVVDRLIVVDRHCCWWIVIVVDPPSLLLTDRHRCWPTVIVVDWPSLLLTDCHRCWPMWTNDATLSMYIYIECHCQNWHFKFDSFDLFPL